MNEFDDLLQLGERPARRIVFAISPPATVQAFDRHCAARFAEKLLRDGLDVRATAYRVAARYDVSLKSAYRRINSVSTLGTPSARR